MSTGSSTATARRLVQSTALALLAGAFLLSSAGASPSATSHGAFRTGIVLPDELAGSTGPLVLSRSRAAGASLVRLTLPWSAVAPAVRPPDFVPEDPASPGYDWTAFDSVIRRTVAAGLQPFVSVLDAPTWAERAPGAGGPPGTNNPDPVQFSLFARAAASRYSGAFQGLPRVRYWGAWNEPNLSLFMWPQLVKNVPYSPGWYRQIVNGFAASVHGVHSDNLVVAGETAPFQDITPIVLKQRKDWGPLTFMRDLLCLSRSLKPTCKDPVHFDAWAHHPYTSGGPTHHAVLPDDVSLGDLGKMRRVLDAGIRAGHVLSQSPVQFWMTEFSWDSMPPDPHGVPTWLLERWVPQALYRMWLSHVSVVIWYSLRDEPLSSSFFQSGLYYRGKTMAADRPKPYLQGFRFPFVAFPAGRRVVVWGRAPTGRTVVVEQSLDHRWRRVGSLPADSSGIFYRRLSIPRRGALRAVAASGERSPPFSLKAQRDRFYNPFGLTHLLEPKPKP